MAHRLQGPLGNNEGDQALAGMSPPNTSPPLETTHAPGAFRASACVCTRVTCTHHSAKAHHPYLAAAWTRVSAPS